MKKKLKTLSFTSQSIYGLTEEFQEFLDKLEDEEKVKDFTIHHITNIVEEKKPGMSLYSFIILYDLQET